MKLLPPLLALLATAGFAQTPASPPPLKPQNDLEKPRFVFSLAPRSMAKNPSLEMTVITELTEAGKTKPVPTAAKPTYYISTAGGFKQMGWESPAREKAPTGEEMEALMRRALAKNGFVPSDDRNPPTLAIIFHWGSFSRTGSGDADSVPVDPAIRYRELIERATLVGGSKFAAELDSSMQERFAILQVQPRERDDPTGAITQEIPLPKTPSLAFSAFDPVERLLARDKITRFLAEQSDTSLYYVIASAFDVAEIAKGHRVLLWRTKMTVDAGGVSMTQTLPTLVASAAPYFGREMEGPAALVQQMREGRIEYGEPTVVGYEEEKAKAAAPKK